MHPIPMDNDTDEGDNAVQENSVDDDSDKDDNVQQENSMQVAAHDFEDDTDQVEDGYTNNEYVEPKNPHPDEFENDSWVNLTYVKNITSKFNRSTVHTAIEDLKVRDIFESKVKLLQAITEWSIKRGVSFTPMKTNITCYRTVCASIRENDNLCRDVCPWRLHAYVPKSSSGYM